jgi:hypothetical protein
MTDILQEAAELINGQRAKDYGDVRENFGRIAQLWSAYHGAYFNRHDVAVFMILVKVARQSNTYHRDSMIDIAGYAALDEKVSDDLWDGIDADILKAQEKRERDRTSRPPRVWDSMHRVPVDVMRVKDKNGNHWYKAVGDRWLSVYDTSIDLAEVSEPLNPFTEVL